MYFEMKIWCLKYRTMCGWFVDKFNYLSPLKRNVTSSLLSL